jgi:PAS domain S-box-containing protein
VPGSGVDARSVSLPPEALSAREARRFVSQLLEESGHLAWLEAAELAVSEIVTNAVLHAHTALTLTANVEHDQVRVEVRDYNPALPSPRAYGEQATTGRGMALVSAITSTSGVTSLGPDGKIVWFTVGNAPATDDLDALLDAWADDGAPDGTADDEGTEVLLLGMPATLWGAARQHHDALLRELALLRAGEPDDDLAQSDVARRLISAAVEGAVDRARDSGVAPAPQPLGSVGTLPLLPAQIDVALVVPADAAHTFAVLQDVLDEAEALARTDRLLIRPALPEIIAVRDWACEQVIAQLVGAPPAAWPGIERFADDVEDALSGIGWDPTLVERSTRGAVAADDANRILAVSALLAEALGWAAADLVGRRVISLIPPRFREAHVAGFTRHLGTGTAHLIGVHLELPVLRSDGSEVQCAFLLESVGTPSGRTVYIAWITPLPQ